MLDSSHQRSATRICDWPSAVPHFNDLPDWIKSEMRMFADDTKIWKKITELKGLLGVARGSYKIATVVRNMVTAVPS